MRERNGFDGELDRFQEPKLSSLWKLVRSPDFLLPLIRADLHIRSEHGRDISAMTRLFSILFCMRHLLTNKIN